MKYFEAVGRRKTSVARVRLFEGKSTSTVNDKPYSEYFVGDNILKVAAPLGIVGLESKMYFTAQVSGGGTTGQLEAIQLGIGRALLKKDETLKPALRKAGFVTRDPRMVERKKYNLRKARKKSQFSKR